VVMPHGIYNLTSWRISSIGPRRVALLLGWIISSSTPLLPPLPARGAPCSRHVVAQAQLHALACPDPG
jgi:hypothetical protein